MASQHLINLLAGSLTAGWSIAVLGPDGLPFTMSAIVVVYIMAAAAKLRPGEK
jgi:hypothetical protein